MALRMLKPRLATFDTSIARPPPKIADSFYHSAEWVRLIREVKLERGNRCQNCGADGDGPEGVRIHGDHDDELKDGGAPLDKRNIRLRCSTCHGVKTAAKARERREREAKR